MKVLHVSSAKTIRGGEYQLIHLINHLTSFGVSNYLACPSGSELSLHKIEGLHKCTTFLKLSPLNILIPAFLKRLSLEENIDLIHVHDAHAHQFVFMSYFFFKNRIPAVVTRRVSFSIKSSSIRMYAYPRFKKIICVSDSVKNVLKNSGVQAEKLITISSGISLNKNTKIGLREKFKIASDEFLIGNFSALSPEKDFMTFIETAKILVEEGKIKKVKFLIAGGDAGMRKAIELKIGELKLGNKIILSGYIPNVSQHMMELDLLLSTSRSEGLPNVILEAFNDGVPVVATRCPGIVDIVDDNINGLLADVGNKKCLANSIHQIFHDEALKDKLVLNGLDTVKQFDVSKLSAEVYECYKEAI